MEKLFIEICMISAQGLPRSSFFRKLQWFAVGWIDPDNKYCSKIDASGSSNPTWRTKFSTYVDTQSLALTVEVHSRDAVFLREKLHGSVTVPLKEFLVKSGNHPDGSTMGFEEAGSFQLRRKSSGKPCGFVDLSVRISGKRTEDNSRSSGQPKVGGGVGSSDSITTSYPPYHPSIDSYEQKMSPPPPPPPPSNVGFIPSFFPTGGRLPGTYVNLPPARTPGPNTTHAGFGAGAGAGALAAGAVIFGDDFMSNSSLPPTSFGGGAESIGASIDPPF